MESNAFQTQGMTELGSDECRQITGGVPWWVAAAVGAAILNVANHWDHFKQGLAGEPEQPEN